jgi:hypothetical protein
MMNKLGAAAVTAGALVVTCLGLGQTAQAGQIQLLTDPTRYTMPVTFIDQVGNESSGEFGVRASNFTGLTPPPMGAGMAGPQSLFQTFCLELDETIVTYNNDSQDVETANPTNGIYSWDISDRAKQGGRNTNSDDVLSEQTAYLYTQFWYGTLAGYNKTFGSGAGSRTESARDLQIAIWYFENELGDSSNGFSPNVNTLTSGAQSFIAAANSAVSGGFWSGLGNVRVLNLYSGTDNVQDVLVLVPLPPAAWLGLGLMSAMGVVGLIRRRRQQALA